MEEVLKNVQDCAGSAEEAAEAASVTKEDAAIKEDTAQASQTAETVGAAAEAAGDGVQNPAETQGAVMEAESATEADKAEDGAESAETAEKSSKPSPKDAAWEKLIAMLNAGTEFPVTIEDVVKAGVVTHVDGIRAFIPASKLAAGYVENLEDYKGKTIDVNVITAEKEGNKLVLSGKEAARRKAKEERARLMAECKVGSEADGVVETLKDYGAFVKLDNGLSGLLHVSQIREERVEVPSDVLKEGEKVHVKVIAIKDGKISLSIKALTAPSGGSKRPPRDNARRDGRDGRDAGEEKESFSYKETGKATTSLGDILSGIKLN